MGIRRTKEYKQQVQLKLAQHQYRYQAPSQSVADSKTSGAVVKSHHDARDLFAYDVKLIYRDLFKTILITVVILGLLVGLTIYLKH